MPPLHDHPDQPKSGHHKRKHGLPIPHRPPHKPFTPIQHQDAHKRQDTQIIQRPILRGISSKLDTELLRGANSVSSIKPDGARVHVLHAVGVRQEGSRRGCGRAAEGKRFAGRGKVADYRVDEGSEAILGGLACQGKGEGGGGMYEEEEVR